ncbi:sn-glycerol-3-phosphate import ATP-binding protein UgpC [Anatilimnocola aggregata]|uniref:sn-glycerol-3-phosphate import ATP-binding protein UgpC n=1 Tax=Anatilimnocola aggregata TaxID=2528021 RepID=A0A517Y4S4_9BACT|nr:ABC transporter ATP-binding protein [Anatilimnocola aggregata]QDU25190.1 sn-glycerol-3-phosphate import ATP-binding protein UgpC [Anatilimnocola aggregata]
MASLQLLGVTKVFANRETTGSVGGVQAVQQVDWEVGDGELLVLFGPSGSGKTTLLRMIAGLEQPSAGRVLMDGVDVTHSSPRERNVALVFQTGSLYGHLTVAQNLAFGLERQNGGWLSGWTGKSSCGSESALSSEQIAERVRDVAERVGIAPWLQRRPAELSGGQQQRVALARALIRRPKLLLLDEPLASLDGPIRLALARELKQQLREQGLTAIHVTHDLTEALTLADRVAVLIDGQLRQLASPREVYDRPADRQVAELFSPRGLNAWVGHLSVNERGWQFAADDGSLQAARLELVAELAITKEASRRVVMALRPEDCDIASASATQIERADCTLEVVPAAGSQVVAEWLGSDCFGSLLLEPRSAGRLVFRWNEALLGAIQPESRLRVLGRRVLWFEETGKRTTLEQLTGRQDEHESR